MPHQTLSTRLLGVATLFAMPLLAPIAAAQNPPPAAAAAAPLAAPQGAPLAVNFVRIDRSLATAGQPDADALGRLAEDGYEVVINLAPPQSRGSVAEEASLVAAQGLAYVNIPVDWQRPTFADFDLFSAVMAQAEDRSVLVHCQMNMRASVFTFLHRVVHENVPAADAFEAVSAVWQPAGAWTEFAGSVLEREGIEFTFPPAN